MKNKPLDLLGLLHRIGFSIKESQSGVWYASKTIDGHFVGYFADDVTELYKLCVNSSYNVRLR